MVGLFCPVIPSGESITATGCPEQGWMLHTWECSRSAQTGLWATQSRGRCPCTLQGGGTRWLLKVLSNTNHSVVLWFFFPARSEQSVMPVGQRSSKYKKHCEVTLPIHTKHSEILAMANLVRAAGRGRNSITLFAVAGYFKHSGKCIDDPGLIIKSIKLKLQAKLCSHFSSFRSVKMNWITQDLHRCNKPGHFGTAVRGYSLQKLNHSPAPDGLSLQHSIHPRHSKN